MRSLDDRRDTYLWGITHVLRVDPMAHVREIVDLDRCPRAERSSMERRNALDETM